MEINETPVCFGPEGTLIGILTQPVGSTSKVGCLLLNTGVNHRIGPRRINVKAARRLAGSGIPSLRFDLSGVGDSRASSAQNDFRRQAVLDMQAALDHFQATTGISEFMIFGICSGAANGMALTLVDPRIVGLLMFDGEIYLSRRVRIERKLRRWASFPFNPTLRLTYPAWMDWAAWARAPADAQARAKALGHLWGRLAPKAVETGILDANTIEYKAADYVRDMTLLVDRGVDIYMMYSATLSAIDHDRDMLSGLRKPAFLQRVRYKFWTDIDHTVTQLDAQRRLLDEVVRWAQGVVTARPGTRAATGVAYGSAAAPVAHAAPGSRAAAGARRELNPSAVAMT